MLNAVKLFAEEILSIKEMGKLRKGQASVLGVVCYQQTTRIYQRSSSKILYFTTQKEWYVILPFFLFIQKLVCPY